MDVTYPELGRTRPDAGGLPAGYHHLRRDALLGRGQGVFTTAVAVLRSLRMQRAAGLAVRPPGAASVDTGTEFAVGLGVGPLRVWAPTRVVWVVDSPTRFGYGIGTLPGHPERGEEAFLVTLGGAGSVRFDVIAFSRPAAWYVRLAGPLSRLGQRYVVGRYVAAMRRLTAGM